MALKKAYGTKKKKKKVHTDADIKNVIDWQKYI